MKLEDLQEGDVVTLKVPMSQRGILFSGIPPRTFTGVVCLDEDGKYLYNSYELRGGRYFLIRSDEDHIISVIKDDSKIENLCTALEQINET